MISIFFLPIFTLISVANKYEISLRTNVAMIIYLSQFISFILLLVFHELKLKFNSKKKIKTLILFFGSVFWLWVFTPTNISYILKITLNIMIGYIGYRVLIQYKKISLKILKNILILNISALFIEFIWFTFFQNNLQIHNFLFPFSRENFIDLNSGFFRPCGLQYEPGNYSIISTILILLIYIFDKKPNTRLFVFGIISIIITKSLVGIFLAIILFIFLFFRKGYLSVKFLISFSTLLILFMGSVLTYVFFRLDNLDTFRSLTQKIYLFDVWLQKDFLSVLKGHGIESYDNIIFDRNLGFVKDLGVLFNLFYTYGLYALFIFFWFIKEIRANNFFQTFLLLTIIFFTKLGSLYPIFFLFIFSLAFPKKII